VDSGPAQTDDKNLNEDLNTGPRFANALHFSLALFLLLLFSNRVESSH
jgi:hypothetical protein